MASLLAGICLTFGLQAGAAMAEPPIRVRIVDATTGKPCASAIVHVIGADHAELRRERTRFEDDPEWFSRLGQRLVADANGIAIVPDSIEAAFVGARTATGWGSVAGQFEPRAEPYVIGVCHVASVTMRIVDADDRPSAVTLSAMARSTGGWDSLLQVRADPATGRGRLHMPTALGCAVEPHPFHLEPRVDDGEVVDVFLDMVAANRLVASLDAAGPVPDAMTVRVPAFGALVVRAETPDGQPVRVGGVFAWPLEASGGRRPGPPHHTTIRDGVARFPAVALGLRIELHATGEGKPTVARVAGPTQAGEERVVELELADVGADGSRHVQVVGRLRLPDGASAGERTITVARQRDSKRQPHSEPTATTAADGSFEVHVGGLLPPDDRLLITSSSGSSAVVDLWADVALGTERGRVDLGEITLQAAALVCSGRVVDEQGAGMRGRLYVTSTKLQLVELLPGTRDETDRDGHFQFFATRAPEVRLALQASASAMAGLPVSVQDVRPGTRDLELRIARGLVVTGAVLLDDGVPRTAVTAQLVLASLYGVPGCGLDKVRNGVPRPVTLDGSFLAGNVEPGTYHLVFAWGGAFEIGKVPDVVIDADGTCADERLRAVDLRGTLRLVTVTVDDEVLVPGLANQDLTLRRVPGSATLPHQQGGTIRTALRGRPLRIHVPHGRFDVGIATPTHTSDRVEIRGPEVRVRMRTQ